ncbi:MAG: protein kinase [Deltaproteobacteria bacterium]|nr:protein kinase [Deltaproteobacteria bacterium]
MGVSLFLEARHGVGIEGTVLDSKYRIVRLVGEGGMGAVYEAEHVKVRRRVAVKFLSPELAHDVSAVERFQREAEAAGRIGHDNICEVFDFGVGPAGSPYFVMPLLKGCALSEAIRAAGRFPPARACDVAAQTLAALSEAHAAGIVHRDLKPDNIFLTRIGDRDDFVKILDFGISKVLRHPTLGGGDGKPELTKTGSVLGTPAYMAPEQARGVKDIDARVDVYAMGVILYEMLTGRRPFDGESFNEVLWKLWNDPVTPPRAYCADLSPELEHLVLRAMSRDREQRHASASALRQAVLDAAAAARAGAARPAGTLLTLDASGPTAPAPPPAAAVAAKASTAPGPAPAQMFTPGAGSVVPSTAMMVPRRRGPLYATLALLAALAAGVSAFFLLRDDRSGRDAAGSPRAAPSPTQQSAATPAVAATTPLRGTPLLPAASTLPAPGIPDAAEPAAIPPTTSPDAGQTPTAETSAVPLPATVRIFLQGVPSGAAVTVDGSAAEGPAFDVPRADRTVDVVVRAPGFEPWRRAVSASAPASIPVRLQRATGTVRPPRADAGTGGTAAADVGVARDARGAVDGTVSQFGAVP